MNIQDFFDNCISCIDCIAKEQELLEQLDVIRRMYKEKDQLISNMKQELQAKQEEMLSLSDQFEQREEEILEQKGKQKRKVNTASIQAHDDMQ